MRLFALLRHFTFAFFTKLLPELKKYAVDSLSKKEKYIEFVRGGKMVKPPPRL